MDLREASISRVAGEKYCWCALSGLDRVEVNFVCTLLRFIPLSHRNRTLAFTFLPCQCLTHRNNSLRARLNTPLFALLNSESDKRITLTNNSSKWLLGAYPRYPLSWVDSKTMSPFLCCSKPTTFPRTQIRTQSRQASQGTPSKCARKISWYAHHSPILLYLSN